MKMHKMIALAGLALLALLAGCESDPVAPQDELPDLTSEERANQSVVIAVATAEAATRVLAPGTPIPSKSLRTYAVTGEGFGGSVLINYLSAEGVPDPMNEVTPETAGWAHLFTLEGVPVTYTTPLGGTTEFHLDFTAVLEQGPPREALINGEGTMISGDYTVEFSVEDLEIEEGEDYPLGSIAVTSMGHSVAIGFDGDHTATVLVDNVDLYIADLETGEVTFQPPI
jgi:hypothetical protein